MSVALLFSPQGSQQVGMGRALAAANEAANAVYAAADQLLGWSVSELCWHGPEAQLDDTRWTQPALFVTSLAALEALRSTATPRVAFVAGHSVGEYAALVAAGSIRFEDGLRLVVRRAELMAAHAGGGMAAVLGLERDAVEAVVAEAARPTELVVANDNAPGQVVISGQLAAIDAAEPLLRAAGAKRVIRLRVSGAFHSPLMAPVAEALGEAFEPVDWHDADPPVVSNVTAEPVRDAGRIRALLAEQVRSPVEWVRSVQRMAADGADTFVECGPGGALAGMVRRIVPGATALAVVDPAALAEAAAVLNAAAPAAASVPD